MDILGNYNSNNVIINFTLTYFFEREKKTTVDILSVISGKAYKLTCTVLNGV